MSAADLGEYDPVVVPVRDIAEPEMTVENFLFKLKGDASAHMGTAGECALKHNWDDVEIHVEIALDRIKMINEIRAEMENYR